jgi:putative aminopeptidase FrvX
LIPLEFEYLKTLLMKLLSTPSPTGDTTDILQMLEKEVTELGLIPTYNRKGGLLFTVPGADTTKWRMITAHVDTLGGMVKEVLPTGRIRIHKVGGYAWSTIEGEYCGIKTESGRIYTGTVILHNTSVHVNREIDKTERTEENIEIVLDAKVSNKEDVLNLGIRVGDFIHFDPRVTWTDTGFVKSRHLDDKASVAIILSTIKELLTKNSVLPHPVLILISNNEEIGYGGNSNIPDEVVEYLAVDMGAIGDGQATDEYCVSICAMDASGPYHQGLRRRLTSLAKSIDLNYQVDIYPYYGSDASAAMRAGADVVHGLIGPGVANSHAYERTHQEALQNTASLLKAYLLSPMSTHA